MRAFFLLAAVAVSTGLMLTVVPNGEECVYERIAKDNKLSGSFEVTSGGDFDISVFVTGPNGDNHYKEKRSKSGSFQFMSPVAGLYKVCFVNKDTTFAEKVVALSLHAGDELFQDIAKQEHITPLETEITQLTDGIAKIEDEQQYMWARERQTTETNASTNARVFWFSVAETTVILGLGVWQILTLRAFFQRTKRT